MGVCRKTVGRAPAKKQEGPTKQVKAVTGCAGSGAAEDSNTKRVSESCWTNHSHLVMGWEDCLFL